jgi:hypothetical protein
MEQTELTYADFFTTLPQNLTLRGTKWLSHPRPCRSRLIGRFVASTDSSAIFSAPHPLCVQISEAQMRILLKCALIALTLYIGLVISTVIAAFTAAALVIAFHMNGSAIVWCVRFVEPAVFIVIIYLLVLALTPGKKSAK